MTKALIIGTGGHAQMIWAHSQLPGQEWEITGWLEKSDFNGPETLLDLPVYRQTPEILKYLQETENTGFIFGIGMSCSAAWRYSVYSDLCDAGLRPLTFVHPEASVSPTAQIAPGCFIGARAVIQPFTNINEACIINTGAIIEHHCEIAANTHVGPGAIVCGQVTVGRDGMIGANAVIIQLLAIGVNVTVGAGSVIINPVPDGETIVGNPGRTLVRGADRPTNQSVRTI